MKTTPANISKLEDGQVFVFGSNEAGVHGAGAAALAKSRFGAEWGKGVGLHGQSYAIPTKDKKIETLGLGRIRRYVAEFIEFAQKHRELEFLVTQVGCGLAGYEPKDIAPLFFEHAIPSNVSLPAEFWAVQKK